MHAVQVEPEQNVPTAQPVQAASAPPSRVAHATAAKAAHRGSAQRRGINTCMRTSSVTANERACNQCYNQKHQLRNQSTNAMHSRPDRIIHGRTAARVRGAGAGCWCGGTGTDTSALAWVRGAGARGGGARAVTNPP